MHVKRRCATICTSPIANVYILYNIHLKCVFLYLYKSYLNASPIYTTSSPGDFLLIIQQNCNNITTSRKLIVKVKSHITLDVQEILQNDKNLSQVFISVNFTVQRLQKLCAGYQDNFHTGELH